MVPHPLKALYTYMLACPLLDLFLNETLAVNDGCDDRHSGHACAPDLIDGEEDVEQVH